MICTARIDAEYVKGHLPKRPCDSNKGSFGRALIIAGSEQYMGAAHLVLGAALRGGAGYVELVSEECVWNTVILKYPELIYTRIPSIPMLSADDCDRIMARAEAASAILIGPGCGKSRALADLVMALVRGQGGPVIIDADAINSIAEYYEDAIACLREARRPVILTPHPLEFSRLTGIPTNEVSNARLESAYGLSLDTSATVLLKGAGTVVTDGKEIMINTTGSSALAKAGSGDALAGFMVSLLSMGAEPLAAAAIAAYVHGRAGQILAEELSEYGVTPSDLAPVMARVLAEIASK
ncbi:MAG: NAD(P)H-hydrate dehydratase [Ruminococcaceae bacterium]|nr:NAD(P)H-hydrate dehydratase [Oscillospiraceae bacterium]